MALRPTAARPWLPLAALLFIGGCGMYGDLYLEEPEPPARPEVEELEPIAGDDAAAEQALPEEEDKPAQPKQPPPDGGQAAGRR